MNDVCKCGFYLVELDFINDECHHCRRKLNKRVMTNG